ncbi:MAG: hypothetical protein ACD_21C00286G0003 [uncultured bacterium]|nr:MAG: hypothetical protein ACD_21C00286G0003 [uncultured bacterium]
MRCAKFIMFLILLVSAMTCYGGGACSKLFGNANAYEPVPDWEVVDEESLRAGQQIEMQFIDTANVADGRQELYSAMQEAGRERAPLQMELLDQVAFQIEEEFGSQAAAVPEIFNLFFLQGIRKNHNGVSAVFGGRYQISVNFINVRRIKNHNDFGEEIKVPMFVQENLNTLMENAGEDARDYMCFIREVCGLIIDMQNQDLLRSKMKSRVFINERQNLVYLSVVFVHPTDGRRYEGGMLFNIGEKNISMIRPARTVRDNLFSDGRSGMTAATLRSRYHK